MAFMAIAIIFPVLASITTSLPEKEKVDYNISLSEWQDDVNFLQEIVQNGTPSVLVNVPIANSKKVIFSLLLCLTVANFVFSGHRGFDNGTPQHTK